MKKKKFILYLDTVTFSSFSFFWPIKYKRFVCWLRVCFLCLLVFVIFCHIYLFFTFSLSTWPLLYCCWNHWTKTHMVLCLTFNLFMCTWFFLKFFTDKQFPKSSFCTILRITRVLSSVAVVVFGAFGCWSFFVFNLFF